MFIACGIARPDQKFTQRFRSVAHSSIHSCVMPTKYSHQWCCKIHFAIASSTGERIEHSAFLWVLSFSVNGTIYAVAADELAPNNKRIVALIAELKMHHAMHLRPSATVINLKNNSFNFIWEISFFCSDGRDSNQNEFHSGAIVSRISENAVASVDTDVLTNWSRMHSMHTIVIIDHLLLLMSQYIWTLTQLHL